MSGYNATPIDGSTPPIPMSSAVSPGDKTPRALRGGPETVDSQSNTLVDLGVYVYMTALVPYGSNPTQTAASGADTLYKFGASGTTPFGHFQGQNNTPANVYLAVDASTTVSGNAVYVIAPGGSFAFDRQGSVLHFSSPAQQAFGGQSGITVEAFA